MATDKKFAPNIDNSDTARYPNGRIKDNTGAGDGTPVNRLVYGDIHEFFAKLMRLAGVDYNGLPDNEVNGYQLVEAVAALAGKNDYVYNLNLVSGGVEIGTDISILKNNERLLCKSTFNINSTVVTQIKGTKPSVYTIAVPSEFKANDYIFLIKTSTSVILQRIADGNNLDAIAAEYNYLKAATDAEEFAGAITTKASTPYTAQLAFARRVIGLDSGIFLATSLRNGLMSKEDKAILDGLTDPVKNRGWFSGLDAGSAAQTGTLLPRSGDILSATVVSTEAGHTSNVRVVFANPIMTYFCRFFIESEGSLSSDNSIGCPVFKRETSNQFLFSIEEFANSAVVTNLKIHIEVVQI